MEGRRVDGWRKKTVLVEHVRKPAGKKGSSRLRIDISNAQKTLAWLEHKWDHWKKVEPLSRGGLGLGTDWNQSPP